MQKCAENSNRTLSSSGFAYVFETYHRFGRPGRRPWGNQQPKWTFIERKSSTCSLFALSPSAQRFQFYSPRAFLPRQPHRRTLQRPERSRQRPPHQQRHQRRRSQRRRQQHQKPEHRLRQRQRQPPHRRLEHLHQQQPPQLQQLPPPGLSHQHPRPKKLPCRAVNAPQRA